MITTVLTIVLICTPIEGMLISLNKKVIKSSEFQAKSGTGTGYGEYAVDGYKTRTSDDCECCAVTNHSYNPWYRLDLGKEFIISEFEILGRLRPGDLTYQNIGSVTIAMTDTTNTTVFSDETPNEAIYEYTNTIIQFVQARFIYLLKHGVKGHFTICELSVYGDCVDGEFGDDCNGRCYCKNITVSCDKRIGTCPQGGCLAGYHGTACDAECPDGQFGLQCTGRCYCTEGPCNKTTGECQGDCSPGFKGFACDELCDFGYFGQNCTSSCGQCTEGETCDIFSGLCTGCMPGYLTEFCNKTCSPGYYGQNCSLSCGHCKNESVCDLINGVCYSGCLEMYTGLKCVTNASMIQKEESRDTSSWLIPVIIVAIICSVVIVTVILIALFVFRRRNRASGNDDPVAESPSNYEDLDSNRDTTFYDSIGNVQITETRT